MRPLRVHAKSLRLTRLNKLSMNALSFKSSDLPSQFTDSDYITQCKIISLGTTMYYNGNKWIYSEMHNKSLEDSKLKIETLITTHESNITELKQMYNEKISQHSQLIEEKYNETLLSKDLLLQNYANEILDLKERCKLLESQNIEALSIGNKIDSLLGKKSTVDNITKGNFGESIVWNQITHYYPASILEDCSDNTAAGDMLWTLQSFNALVEVKNVQHVRPGEIQKFERDLLQNSNNGNINAGLFVSLKTETIPGKGTLFFEFFNNIPVVYVSHVYENMQNLKLAMEILYNIQSTLGSTAKQEESQILDFPALQNTINDFVQSIFQKQKQQLQNLQKMKQSHEIMGQTITAEEKFINDNLSTIETLKQTLNWIVYNDIMSSQKSSRKTQAVEFFISFYKTHDKWPNTSEIPDYKASIYRGEMSLANIKAEAQKFIGH